ncbi:MAG: hypothetical protein M1834_000805 [Cirrosporium novae-zelandiae]|nr:MAG: hypothetical protein M1834_000805 [Cirrosporium novae-zelandiae]
MTTLFNPQKPTVDIIAVTGLAGHALGSWKVPNGNAVWLRDWLPQQVSNARILTYGYDSRLLKNKSKCTIEQLASKFLEALKTSRGSESERQRPIIFIAHDLGGLLVKSAIAQAGASGINESQENIDVLKSCYGFLFFGVPNQGLNHQQLKLMVRGEPNEELMNALITTCTNEPSEYLKGLHEKLCERFKFNDSQVVSYYECYGTKAVKAIGFWEYLQGLLGLGPSVGLGELHRSGPEVMMVTQASATSGFANQKPCDQIPVERDHLNLVKFPSEVDQLYRDVTRRIDNLVLKAPAVVNKRFSLQFSRSDLSQEEQIYHQQLAFPELHRRRHEVDNPMEDTCTWIYEQDTNQKQQHRLMA